jgi:lambda family phage tail tape measure protein
MASTVTVDFNANLARFTSAIDKATSDLNKFQTNASRISGNINKAFGAIGVGISAAGIISFAKTTIDALDNLNDLNKSTGIAVEQLAGLGLAAEQSGGDLESIAASINKLSTNIGQNAEKFQKLGITAKEPLEAFKQLSDIFVSIEDPQKRAAFAAEALGKSWQGAAPLLAEGSRRISEMVEEGARLSGVNKRNVEQADAFNDSIARLKFASQGAVTPLLEPLTNLVTLFTNAAKEADYFSGVISRLKLAATLSAPGLAAPFTVFGAGQDSPSQTSSGTIKRNVPEAESSALDKRVCEFTGGTWDGKKCVQKKPKASSISDDPTKKLLDNTLSALEKGIGRENDLLASRNRFLDLYNSQNLLSIRSYYRQRNEALQSNLEANLAAYDKEIAALEKFQAKTKSRIDKADAQGKINDILEKRNKLLTEASEQTAVNAVEEQNALKAYADSINDVNAQILELSGNLRDAAAIRFDQSVSSLRDRFTSEGNTQALQQLDTLRKYTLAQAELNKFTEEAGIVNDQLSNAESRIDIARKSGATSELQTLQQISDARTSAADQLEVIYENYRKVAAQSGNPRLIQDAENLRVELEKLRAESDLVAQRFETIFVDSFSNAFSDFVTGAKTAEEAFMDFTNSVVAQISRLAAQDLATSLYGSLKDIASESDFLSGISEFFGGLFNANGNAFNQSGVMAFANGGVFDKATPFSFGGGKLGVMGEAGPEAILPLKRGSNGQLGVQMQGGAPNIVMNIQTPNADSFRKSQKQIMAEAQRGLNSAQRIR